MLVVQETIALATMCFPRTPTPTLPVNLLSLTDSLFLIAEGTEKRPHLRLQHNISVRTHTHHRLTTTPHNNNTM
jgi:hypothetical protein